MREIVADIGICHYIVVVRKPSGEAVQFDFGPRGGRDVSAARGGVPGEVREQPLQPGLMDGAILLHMGSTHLGLDQVREFNAQQPRVYALLQSDWCAQRHSVAYISLIIGQPAGISCHAYYACVARMHHAYVAHVLHQIHALLRT